MTSKAITAVVTVLAGIGIALVVYWLLDRLAGLFPSRWEHRIKPYFYILPAYAAISVFLLYPAVLTVINSFKDKFSQKWIGTENYTKLLGAPKFRDTLFNTLLWIIIVPAATVILGLATAALADRLKPRAEKLAKTIIFLPMAISLVGASVVWRFVYAVQPAGRPQIGIQNAVVDRARVQARPVDPKQHAPRKQPVSDGHSALGTGGVRHGVALVGGQGRSG